MPIVDAVFVLALQARQHFLLAGSVPHLDGVGEHACLHPFADQPCGHRVDVPLDGDRTARLHPHALRTTRLQPPGGQWIQEIAFIDECLLSLDVAPRTQVAQERRIGFLAREVMTATQQQRLLHRTFEAMMALLAITVLVTRVRIDRLRLDLVVRHQRLITARELLRPRSLNRQRHAIGAMELRHAAECPHRILKPRTETLETLGETERHMFPVRVRQHEVVDQVRERLAVDRHAQLGHVREVGGAQPTRRMLLREEDFLGRTARRQPVLDAPLQRPQLPVGELAGMSPLQFLE